MRRRIGIDCRKLTPVGGKSMGIYNYSINLVQQLATIHNRSYEVVVLGNAENRDDMNLDGVEFIEYRILKSAHEYVTWELFGVHVERMKHKIDWMLYPRGFIPLLDAGHSVAIIHDLIPFYYEKHYPGYFSGFESKYIRNRLKASARKAGYVLSISKHSTDEIKKSFDRSQKIDFIYNTYNINTEPRNQVKEENIFAMTSGLPHKNYRGILKCYEHYLRLGGHKRLVISGISKERKLVDGFDPAFYKNIEYLPYLSRQALNEKIASASCFLFLSKIEGFGYPPIEAMDLGTLVISSKGGSLEEVVGDGGILVDDEIEAAKILLALDYGDIDVSEYIEKGYQNLSRYSQEAYQYKINQLIEMLLK